MTCDVIFVTYGALLIDYTCHCYHCTKQGQPQLLRLWSVGVKYGEYGGGLLVD